MAPLAMAALSHGRIGGAAQNSAYAAQNSTKVAQHFDVVSPLKAVDGKLT